jgi:hypothetical protein
VFFASTIAGSEDLHLTGTDTGARNRGEDLSVDANLAFSNDIDGDPRPLYSVWDIGADETNTSDGAAMHIGIAF